MGIFSNQLLLTIIDLENGKSEKVDITFRDYFIIGLSLIHI